jgi:hypothetical protein
MTEGNIPPIEDLSYLEQVVNLELTTSGLHLTSKDLMRLVYTSYVN